jgi:hypothetical protein
MHIMPEHAGRYRPPAAPPCGTRPASGLSGDGGACLPVPQLLSPFQYHSLSQKVRYMPIPVPVPVPDNCQTACDDRLMAGPLRGDPASPRVSEGTGQIGKTELTNKERIKNQTRDFFFRCSIIPATTVSKSFSSQAFRSLV